MKNISVQIAAKLEEQDIIIQQSPDNEYWTEILIKDTCTSHLDANRIPRNFTTFETKELYKIIKALSVYHDAITTD
jgi:hypothetical protein